MVPKKNRLTKAFFRELHIRPQIIRGEHTSLAHYPSGLSFPRFAVIVSKKVDKSAVGRNRIKRRYLAILQEFLPKLSHQGDFVFRIHSQLLDLSYDGLRGEITKLLNLHRP